MEQYIVSARKYRPLTFASVVGQMSIAQTLKNAISRNQLAHAYLFCGPRGVGKTTCARIFAKTINCLSPNENGDACGICESCKAFAENRSYNIHELDAASNNSVEDVRLLIEKVRIPPQIGKYSIYIIDEVHMLSSSAFNAFLKTLEEPPAHAIFILATTEKHKIIPTILSRCQIYDFNRIRIDDTVDHLSKIAKEEHVNVEPEALHIIAQKSEGSMRDALSIFDQVVSFCGDNVTYAKVIENLNVLDYDYYFKLTDAFIACDYCTSLTIFDQILSKGFDAQHFIRGLNSHFRDLLVCKDTRTTDLLEVGASIATSYKEQAETCTVNFLFKALALANTCDVGYKTSSNQRLHVELTLCNLSSITTQRTVEVSNKIVETTTAKVETKPIEKPKVEEIKIPETKSEQKEEKEAILAEEKKQTTVPKRPESTPLQGLGNLNKLIENTHNKLADNKKEEQEENIAECNESFSEEQLLAAWTAYAQSVEQKQVRLASAMKSTKPIIKEENTIIFHVQNDTQKQFLESKGIAKIISNYLQKELQNTNIKLMIEIDNTGVVETPKLYTDADKEKHLQEKNPDLINFQANLDLY